MKKLLAVMLILGLAVMAAGPASAADTIRIGLLAPLSHQVGEGEVNAAKMAVKRINEAGGIDGKKLELFIEDTRSNPKRPSTATRSWSMVDKVKAVMGAFSSGVVLSLMDHVARYKVPFISTASSSNTLWREGGRELRPL